MSTLRKVYSDSAITAMRKGLSIVRGLVVIPLITNLLGADSYGIWVTVLAVVGLLSSTGGMHLQGSLVRYISRETDENQTYSDVLFLSVVLGGTIAVVGILASTLVDVSALFDREVGNQLTLAVVSFALVFSTILFKINVNFPRANGYVKLYDLLKVCRILLEIVVLIAVFLLGGDVIAGLSGLVAVSLFLNVLVVSFVLARFRPPLPDPANFRQYVSYGIPMVPKELSGTLLNNTDKYLLLYFLGPAAVGIYTVAQTICKPLRITTGIFNSTLYPTIAGEWDEGNFEDIVSIYRSIFRFYSIVGIPAMVGVVLLADPLLELVSTVEIARAGAHLVPVFIFGYFLMGYDNSIEYIPTSAERTDIIGGSVTVAAVLNIVLNVVLIPQFGMLGAAVATLLSQIVRFGILLYFSLTEISLAIPWRTIQRSVLGALVMGAVLFALDLDLEIYESLVVYPVGGAVVHFSVLLVLGEFSRSELSQFKREVGNALPTHRW